MASGLCVVCCRVVIVDMLGVVTMEVVNWLFGYVAVVVASGWFGWLWFVDSVVVCEYGLWVLVVVGWFGGWVGGFVADCCWLLVFLVFRFWLWVFFSLGLVFYCFLVCCCTF